MTWNCDRSWKNNHLKPITDFLPSLPVKEFLVLKVALIIKVFQVPRTKSHARRYTFRPQFIPYSFNKKFILLLLIRFSQTHTCMSLLCESKLCLWHILCTHAHCVRVFLATWMVHIYFTISKEVFKARKVSTDLYVCTYLCMYVCIFIKHKCSCFFFFLLVS